MYEISNNFLNWYKYCCSVDSTLYRQTKYNKNKAKTFYLLSKNSDYIIYPLDGTQTLIFGNIDYCQNYIEENLNTKFLIFCLKSDCQKSYYLCNQKIIII